VAGSYVCALGLKNAPSVIACSRTGMPVQAGTSVANVAKGAYSLTPVAGAALIIAATGSELDLAVQVWPLGAWDILPVLWVRVANGCQPWPIAQSVA
jgi:transketolase